MCVFSLPIYSFQLGKRDGLSVPSNVEDSLERFSKVSVSYHSGHNYSVFFFSNCFFFLLQKICGTLDRMAAAAEEANSIQHGMVNAMNRLASSFEQLLPIVAKVLSNNLKPPGSS